MVRAGQILGDTARHLKVHARQVAVWAAVILAWNMAIRLLLRPWFVAQAADGGGPLSAGLGMIVGLLSLTVTAVIFAAALRTVLFPQAAAAFHLRLGRDEARIFVLLLVATVAMMAGGFVLGLLLGLAVGVVAVWTRSIAAAGFAGGAAVVAMIGAAIFVTVRLMPVWPLTLLRGEIAIGRGWSLGEGRLRPLLVAMLVVAVVSVLAFVLIGLLVLVLVAGSHVSLLFDRSGDGVAEQLAALRVELIAGTAPGVIVGQMLGAFIGGVTVAANGFLCASATLRLIDDKAGIA